MKKAKPQFFRPFFHRTRLCRRFERSRRDLRISNQKRGSPSHVLRRFGLETACPHRNEKIEWAAWLALPTSIFILDAAVLSAYGWSDLKVSGVNDCLGRLLDLNLGLAELPTGEVVSPGLPTGLLEAGDLAGLVSLDCVRWLGWTKKPRFRNRGSK